MKLQVPLILAATLAVGFRGFAFARDTAATDSAATASLADTSAALRDL